MMCFEKDLVNKAIALIDEKSKSDELKAFTDVNDINNMIRNLQINRDYQCDAIKLNQRLREEYPNIEGLEYKSVKIVIPSNNAEKITHSIFYTAITRAKEKLKIFWSAETMKSIIESFTSNDIEQVTLPIIKKNLQQ